LIALPNGGNDNTSIGSNSMLSANNGSADQNTCVGSQAGKTLTTGNKNTFIGNEAASSTFTTGTKCTIVGSESTTSSSGADNQISLGQGITGQADNTAIIGNSDVTAVYAAQDKDAIVYCGGIQFDDAGEVLESYEEGTWTPTLPNGGSVTVQSAQYTKIGRNVYYTFYATVTPTNDSSEFQIGGLPFTATGGSVYPAGSVGYSGAVNTSSWHGPLVTVSNTTIYLHQNSGTTAIVPSSWAGGAATGLIFTGEYIAS